MRTHIPFHEQMEDAALFGVTDPATGDHFYKDMTSRSHIMADPGDVFPIRGEDFELVSIKRMRLETVARDYHRREGFLSEQAFIDFWKMLHPRKGFNPRDEVWAHVFKRSRPAPPRK